MDHKEKVVLVILVTLTLISLVISVYVGLNQTCTNIRTCLNEKLYVVNMGADIDKEFKEKYEGLKNKIGDFEVVSYDPPMQPGNLSVSDWNQIVKDLEKQYDKYDAFVILASHDTIPYTAAAPLFHARKLGEANRLLRRRSCRSSNLNFKH